MASSLLPPASITKTNNLKQPHCSIQSTNALSFGFPSHALSNLHFSAKGLRCNRSHSTLVKAQSDEVRFWNWFPFKDLVSVFSSFGDLFSESSTDFKITGNRSVNDAQILESKLEGSKSEKKVVKPESEHTPVSLASEASIAEFMTQVSILVKLVDSRDVVELQLKQSDCELVIRKKEALPQPSVPDNVLMVHSPPPAAGTPPAFTPAPAPAPSSSPPQAPTPSLPSGEAKSSHPPLKCPMAGTFYRCPGPGEPPFVKVGDKVQKGQVVCIVEAMKLMNEIESDRSGTIVEVLVEDGKPVSVDTPLFVIEP